MTLAVVDRGLSLLSFVGQWQPTVGMAAIVRIPEQRVIQTCGHAHYKVL